MLPGTLSRWGWNSLIAATSASSSPHVSPVFVVASLSDPFVLNVGHVVGKLVWSRSEVDLHRSWALKRPVRLRSTMA